MTNPIDEYDYSPMDFNVIMKTFLTLGVMWVIIMYVVIRRLFFIK